MLSQCSQSACPQLYLCRARPSDVHASACARLIDIIYKWQRSGSPVKEQKFTNQKLCISLLVYSLFLKVLANPIFLCVVPCIFQRWLQQYLPSPMFFQKTLLLHWEVRSNFLLIELGSLVICCNRWNVSVWLSRIDHKRWYSFYSDLWYSELLYEKSQYPETALLQRKPRLHTERTHIGVLALSPA